MYILWGGGPLNRELDGSAEAVSRHCSPRTVDKPDSFPQSPLHSHHLICKRKIQSENSPEDYSLSSLTHHEPELGNHHLKYTTKKPEGLVTMSKHSFSTYLIRVLQQTSLLLFISQDLSRLTHRMSGIQARVICQMASWWDRRWKIVGPLGASGHGHIEN